MSLWDVFNNSKLSKSLGNLSRAEKDLLDNLEEGEPIDCFAYLNEDQLKAIPADATSNEDYKERAQKLYLRDLDIEEDSLFTSFAKDNKVRASLIRWLCVDKTASPLVHEKGIQLFNANIDGELDLEETTIERRLRLHYCLLNEGISLSRAKTRLIALGGSAIGKLDAQGLYVKGELFLNQGFEVNKEALLLGSTIEGQFNCTNGKFNIGLSADHLTVKENVFLDNGFEANGEVRLMGATIEGQLACTNGNFHNGLNADSLTVKGGVFLDNGFEAIGEVRLLGATIEGQLNCGNGKFNKGLKATSLTVKADVFLDEGFESIEEVLFSGATIGGQFGSTNAKFYKGLYAERLAVKGSVVLSDGFEANGDVWLPGATIGGQLNCENGKFNKGLSAASLTVKADVLLSEGFESIEEVLFSGATIGGQFYCTNAKFNNGLTAEGLTVKGDVFLSDGFEANGEVRLLGATIEGEFNCGNAKFKNGLNASRLTVKESVFLNNGFEANGEVRFVGATIEGDLACRGGSFKNEGNIAFQGQRMAIKDTLFWEDITRIEGIVDLSHARIGILSDDMKSWPKDGELKIDGLVYDVLAADSNTPKGAKERIEWLGRQMKHDGSTAFEFSPQPYEQLAKVLMEMGHESDARDVIIAKYDALRERGAISGGRRAWYYFLGLTMGYGFRPRRPIGFALAMLAIGWTFFFCMTDQMQPLNCKNFPNSTICIEYGYVPSQCETKSKLEYPEFSPLKYSIETFVPFLNMHQQEYWIPRNNIWLKIYLFLHGILGKLSVTLSVLSLSGIVRKFGK